MSQTMRLWGTIAVLPMEDPEGRPLLMLESGTCQVEIATTPELERDLMMACAALSGIRARLAIVKNGEAATRTGRSE